MRSKSLRFLKQEQDCCPVSTLTQRAVEFGLGSGLRVGPKRFDLGFPNGPAEFPKNNTNDTEDYQMCSGRLQKKYFTIILFRTWSVLTPIMKGILVE